MSMLPTMLAIQALETRYNGYRFRSRLEARWAVFFDALGIKYRYEYASFKSNGICYLPDFWLPDWDCWVEIKPIMPTPHECEKAIRLCIAKQQTVVILAGDVWPDEYKGLEFSHISSEFHEGRLKVFKGVESRYSDPFVLWKSPTQVLMMSEIEPFFYVADWVRRFRCISTEFHQCAFCSSVSLIGGTGHSHDIDGTLDERFRNNLGSPFLKAAFTRARSARFEHGERG